MTNDYYKELSEKLSAQVKDLEVDKIDYEGEYTDGPVKMVEKQKTYTWIRLYLREELTNVNVGDSIILNYSPCSEFLDTSFACFGKKGLEKDADGVINYTGEDDRKVLCLMVDLDWINSSNEIPFMRTLFKNSIHFEYQMIRHVDLYAIHNGKKLDYYDIDF